MPGRTAGLASDQHGWRIEVTVTEHRSANVANEESPETGKRPRNSCPAACDRP